MEKKRWKWTGGKEGMEKKEWKRKGGKEKVEKEGWALFSVVSNWYLLAQVHQVYNPDIFMFCIGRPSNAKHKHVWIVNLM